MIASVYEIKRHVICCRGEMKLLLVSDYRSFNRIDRSVGFRQPEFSVQANSTEQLDLREIFLSSMGLYKTRLIGSTHADEEPWRERGLACSLFFMAGFAGFGACSADMTGTGARK